MYASPEFRALRTRAMPDLRAPEDWLLRLGGIARSRAVDDWIETYLRAEVEDDDYGRRSALKGIADANRADHASAGVPVHAHPPLPNDRAKKIADKTAKTVAGAQVPKGCGYRHCRP
jgi:hypothetical protein